MLLRIRQEASLDLLEAARWYESQKSGTGRYFLGEVRMAFQRIKANPQSYPEIHRGARRALVRRFPYGVIYTVLPGEAIISILAVLHCGREPNLWRERSAP